MDLPQLATLLRENGDKVLNSESKLSLSTDLLKDLNESFSKIIDEKEALTSTFQVIGTSSSLIDLLIDIQFLHDFVQRAASLKLISTKNDNGPVDIRKFKNLKLLEIRKIPVDLVLGLNYLRNHLQYLICVHSINNLRELFINCGGDKSDKYVWSLLKEVNLSYNNLKSIDNSLEYVPWLQSLDLSHNKLVNVQAIDCLRNLKYLNLGFNQLEAVPLFNKELSRKLQILILKNNYIEDLTGLVLLDNLITLDLSCNCLIDHWCLTTLPCLSSLQWLNLEGNPLYFHWHHRRRCAKQLHPNTASVKFLLDGVLLSKSEKLQIGTSTYYASKISRIPRSQTNSPRLHHESISSVASVNTVASEITTIQSDSLSRSQKKEKKIRDAIITDREDQINDQMIASVNSVNSIEASTDHLETKKQIEILREQYGEKWLQNVGGSLVQDALGIPKDLNPKISSSPYEEDFKLHAAEFLETSTGNGLDASAKFYDAKAGNDKADVISDLSTNNTFLTASEGSIYDGNDDSSSPTPRSSDSEGTEDVNDDEMVFLVQRKQKNDQIVELFLIVSNRCIKEQDSINARTINKWYHDMVMKCEMSNNDPATITIRYNRQRRDLQQREYIINDDKEAEQLLTCLKEIEENNNFTILYECMKCCHRFEINSIDIKITDDKLACPSCNSTLVAKVHVDHIKEEDKTYCEEDSFGSCQTARPETPSECSIGSAASVQESNESSLMDSREQLCENSLKRYESDIEVISNPSQSSIEVLQDELRPSRKRSSEERKIYPMPTIHDIVTAQNVLPVALTESSSSSSFTESVCTAYETPKGVTSGPEICTEIRTIQEEESNIPTTDNKSGLISSIFEGFFTGVKEGTKSIAKSSPYQENDNEISFNISENFSNIDHRVKLHLYQHIFEDEYEDFVWLLRCSLLCNGTSETIAACLVLSTQKIYTLQIKDHNNGEDVIGWLVKKDSYTIDRLQGIYSLPWNQGVGIEVRLPGKNTINHLCFLQDVKCTTNFFIFLMSNPLPESCSIVTTFPQQPMLNLQQALLSAEGNDPTAKSALVSLLSIFTKCTITNNASKELSMGVFVVTCSDIILIQDLTWLMPDCKNVPNLKVVQPINNLLELEIEGNILEFHFLDEVKGYEEVWYLDCGSEDNKNTIISATQIPWEKIFSVPLQVNHKVHVA